MKHVAVSLALCFLSSVAGCAPPRERPAPAPAATPEAAPKDPLASGVVTTAQVAAWVSDPTAPLLLDVRTPEEFAEGRVAGAVNIPVGDLASRLAELEPHRERGIVTYCRSGRRATQATDILREAGYGKVAQMDGSIERWAAESRPLQR
jgi:rhodanese-related sulfurtransferase